MVCVPNAFVSCHMKVPEMNGFLTAGRKKNGEVEDELDQSLEGMDHSDDQFDKGTSLPSCVTVSFWIHLTEKMATWYIYP